MRVRVRVLLRRWLWERRVVWDDGFGDGAWILGFGGIRDWESLGRHLSPAFGLRLLSLSSVWMAWAWIPLGVLLPRYSCSWVGTLQRGVRSSFASALHTTAHLHATIRSVGFSPRGGAACLLYDRLCRLMHATDSIRRLWCFPTSVASFIRPPYPAPIPLMEVGLVLSVRVLGSRQWQSVITQNQPHTAEGVIRNTLHGARLQSELSVMFVKRIQDRLHLCVGA